MKPWSRGLLWAILLALAGLSAIAVNTVTETLPSMPEPPMAPVVGMPEQSTGAQAPWQGPHPRLAARPAETFDFPIRPGETGPVEPLFAASPRYPFSCGRDATRPETDQVQVDNRQGHGVPVFAVENGQRQGDDIVGYSKDCQYPTRVRYYYKRQGSGEFRPLEQADADIAQIELDGRMVDYVVRLETGTINRFIYAVAALRAEQGTRARPSAANWNGALIYQFDGGVGIGRNQGDFSPADVLDRRERQLRDGYAVVYSTGTETENHFNMRLAEDTAHRVKRQFTALYGQPRYTIGVGGSGGAIQQYLLAQNSPGLIDGAIALYSFPDMVTQTIHVQDCELLEHYFDDTDVDNPFWHDWSNRRLVEGMNARNDASNRFTPAQIAADVLRGDFSRLHHAGGGSSECVSGWRGLTPLISNPHFVDNAPDYHPDVHAQVNWTYWDDLAAIYGRNAQGHANRPWDNVGVQYGLEALRQRTIDPETFLDLNARVGGWKQARDMAPERFWFLNGSLLPVNLDLWSSHNMRLADTEDEIAPRTRGSQAAARAAYRSGQVFLGFADIPIIDARHYLDPELDMHHAAATFSARRRLQRARGHARNQVIWMSRQPHDPQPEAFTVMRRWLENRQAKPALTAAETRPSGAVHRCYDAQGGVLAEGAGVWDGSWNGRVPGACMQHYPIYSTSRQVAGGPVSGDVFQCRLQSVEQALDSGVYGSVDMRPWRERLERIFPRGVCDYQAPDRALPAELMQALRDQ